MGVAQSINTLFRTVVRQCAGLRDGIHDSLAVAATDGMAGMHMSEAQRGR